MATITNTCTKFLCFTYQQRLLKTVPLLQISVRGKAKSRKPNLAKGITKSKQRGPKVNAGEWVYPGQILVTQFGLRYHPGMNVGINPTSLFRKRDYHLIALEAGKVMISTERVNPDLTHHVARHFYKNRVTQEFYKKFYHVLPTPMENKFRLVDLV